MKRLFLLALLLPSVANAGLILETATNPGTSTGGLIINDEQFIGTRFSLSEATLVTEVGGNLQVGPDVGSFFAAFVALSGPSSLPGFDYLDLASNAIDFALIDLFDATTGSEDRSAFLNLTLGAGDYAVVFGTGLFGAASSRRSVFNRVVTPTADLDSIFANTNNPDWRSLPSTSSPIRVFLRGESVVTAVPAPGTLGLLFSIGLGGFGLARRRRQA